ncbi:MAG TPA: hypothetical protein VNQ32_00060 [Steroidobacteraceae bacterium]|nr:hypothetical protein [Steroidobacteraceae bacterium]
MKAPFAMLASALLAASGARAAEPATAVDTELLEFLGSIDVEDEAWREYLAERPVRPEAGKPADKTPDPKQKSGPPPRGSEQRDKVKQP